MAYRHLLTQRRRKLKRLQKELDNDKSEEARRTTDTVERVHKQPAPKRLSRTRDMPSAVLRGTRKDLDPELEPYGTAPDSTINIVPKTPQEQLLQV